MYRLDNVKDKVDEFLAKEFPEILNDARVSGALDEIANLLFDMLVGEEDNAFTGGGER